ncbi:MAG: HdeD family acid-resistance protein [Bacteroidales bacterium]
MKTKYTRILKAALFIVFGILILSNTSQALKLIATYFGVLAILAGIISIFVGYRHTLSSQPSVAWYIEGAFSLIIGILIISYPESSVNFFMIVFGIWALIIGIMQLTAYTRFKELDIHSGSLLFSAVSSLIVALLLLLKPFESASFISIIIALYAIIYGTTTLINSFR